MRVLLANVPTYNNNSNKQSPWESERGRERARE